MDFSGITEITIPQGNVEKIEETSSGRVLWENVKVKLNTPKWVVCASNIGHTNAGFTPAGAEPIVDIGCELSINKTRNVVSTGILNTVYRPTKGSNSGHDILLHGPYVSHNFSSKEKTITGTSISQFSDGITGCSSNMRVSSISNPIINNQAALNAKWRWGMMLVNTGGNAKFATNYVLIPTDRQVTDNPTLTGYVKVSSEPTAENSVYITGNPERKEYLITGFKSGSAIVKSVPTTDTLTYFSSSIGRTCWAAGMSSNGLYFGAPSGKDSKVFFSSNGTSWSQSNAFKTGNYVLGVEYLSEKNKVCAICSNAGKVALSSDGKTWVEKSAPFSNALAYAYSPECDALVVVDKTKAYITQNFSKWTEALIPGGSVNFKKLINAGQGVFVGYEYLGTNMYFLSIYPPLSAPSNFVVYES